MQQSTDHDAAGAGPEPAAQPEDPPDAGSALEAVLAHRPTCTLCSTTIWRCATADRLWAAYKAATSTS